MRSAIFVDGNYLNNVLDRHHAGARVDFDKLAPYFAPNGEFLRTYYYDAPPYQSDPPTPEEQTRFAAKDRFFASLSRLAKFEVRRGRCARVWDRGTNGWKYMQKRVDVLFSVDLVRLASKNQITRAILIAGDSDFMPAVSVAKDDGVEIVLVHSPDRREYHRDLHEASDERFAIDAPMVTALKR